MPKLPAGAEKLSKQVNTMLDEATHAHFLQQAQARNMRPAELARVVIANWLREQANAAPEQPFPPPAAPNPLAGVW